MGWLVQPLLFFLARCTRNQLIRNIEFLKAENEMLRTRVPRQKIYLSHGGATSIAGTRPGHRPCRPTRDYDRSLQYVPQLGS